MACFSPFKASLWPANLSVQLEKKTFFIFIQQSIKKIFYLYQIFKSSFIAARLIPFSLERLLSKLSIQQMIPALPSKSNSDHWSVLWCWKESIELRAWREYNEETTGFDNQAWKGKRKKELLPKHQDLARRWPPVSLHKPPNGGPKCLYCIGMMVSWLLQRE